MSYWKEDIGWANAYTNYLPAPSGLRRPGYKNALPGSPAPAEVPALLGKPPRAGFEHPQYPRVPSARSDPKQTYRSQISTAPPIDSAMLKGLSSGPASLNTYGAGAGGASRAAFTRALSDTASTAAQRQADEFNQKYRQQAENARANDIRAQRSNVMDRYRMDVAKDIFDADLMTKYKTDIKTKEAYRLREVKNARNQVLSSAMGMLGGLL
jgi:hypothetical protein